MLVRRRAPHVADQIVRRDLQLGVVPPLLRITDLRSNLCELHECLFLGRVGHPGEFVDALLERFEQIADELIHALARLRFEMLGNIQLTDCLAQRAHSIAAATRHGIDRSLPARLLFGDAGQDLAMQFEMFERELLREHRRVSVDQSEVQIPLPSLQRRFVEYFLQALEIAGGRDVEFLQFRRID